LYFLQVEARSQGLQMKTPTMSAQVLRLVQKGIERDKDGRVHAAVDFRESGLFAVEFGKLIPRASRSWLPGLFKEATVSMSSSSSGKAPTSALCCFKLTDLVQCLDCELWFHFTCYGLEQTPLSLCAMCLCAQENSDPSSALRRHVESREDEAGTAADGDYSPAIDGLMEIKEEEELLAMQSAKTVQDLAPHYRRLRNSQHRKIAAAVAARPEYSDVKWVPPLPAGASVCYVLYDEKSCSCLGYVHSGHHCSHVYGVERARARLLGTLPKRGKGLRGCLLI
jgi:hypothetical protein